MKKNLLIFFQILIAVLVITLFLVKINFSNKLEEQSKKLVIDNSLVQKLTINKKDSTLILNGSERLIKFIYNDTLNVFEPANEQVWNKQLKRVLGLGFYFNDTLKINEFVSYELSNLIAKNQKSAKDSTSAFNQLIKLLYTNDLAIIENRFLLDKHKTETPVSNIDLIANGIISGILLLTILSVSFIVFENKKSNRHENASVISEKEIDGIGTKPLEVIPEILIKYSYNFIEKYGNIYEKIEELPANPSESEKIEIYKQLIEMGIHAHSYHRIGRQNQWKTLSLSPNAQLILDTKVDETKLKEFSSVPKKMDRKFRYLVKLLTQLDISTLDAFLGDEVKLTKENSDN